jgi:integrase
MRRALGYQLARAEKLLGQFVTYLEDLGETHVRTDTALAWATRPTGTSPSGWAAKRLSVVRGFAKHLSTIDPASEIPPADLLRWRARRATPYLYTDEDVAALIAAAATLRTSHRVATYQTLIGLLAVTGMRVGEAIALDCDDFDLGHGVLHRDDRPRLAARTSALLVSTAGTRLLVCNVQQTFRTVVRRAGLKPRSAACRPRIHDVRHRFAVCTFLDAYRQGQDPDARLPLLSTYLGHVDPKNTYWYLSAAPELLQLAGDRLQRHLGGAS